MSYHYHITLKQDRSDTLILEADNKNDLLVFFNLVSTAVLSSIKKIVFSTELNINPTKIFNSKQDYYKEVLIFAKSATKSKVFKLYFVKKTISKDDIQKQFLLLNIDEEKINDIYNIQFIQ